MGSYKDENRLLCCKISKAFSVTMIEKVYSMSSVFQNSGRQEINVFLSLSLSLSQWACPRMGVKKKKKRVHSQSPSWPQMTLLQVMGLTVWGYGGLGGWGWWISGEWGVRADLRVGRWKKWNLPHNSISDIPNSHSRALQESLHQGPRLLTP